MDDSILFYKNNNLNIFIDNLGNLSLSTAETYLNEKLSYEELKAIYVTAEIIKDENKEESKEESNDWVYITSMDIDELLICAIFVAICSILLFLYFKFVFSIL